MLLEYLIVRASFIRGLLFGCTKHFRPHQAEVLSAVEEGHRNYYSEGQEVKGRGEP